MKITYFCQHGKDAHQNCAKGALNDSSKSLIWSVFEQIVFLKICEKCKNYQICDYIPDCPKQLWKFVKLLKILGSSRVPDH